MVGVVPGQSFNGATVDLALGKPLPREAVPDDKMAVLSSAD